MGKRRYNTDPVMAHDRAVKANRARHSPSTYIRALARATLTDADRAALAALLASSLAGQAQDADQRSAA
jgi:hypothetical protein